MGKSLFFSSHFSCSFFFLFFMQFSARASINGESLRFFLFCLLLLWFLHKGLLLLGFSDSFLEVILGFVVGGISVSYVHDLWFAMVFVIFHSLSLSLSLPPCSLFHKKIVSPWKFWTLDFLEITHQGMINFSLFFFCWDVWLQMLAWVFHKTWMMSTRNSLEEWIHRGNFNLFYSFFFLLLLL